jgi:V8-like Glu-specific endopeptidase
MRRCCLCSGAFAQYRCNGTIRRVVSGNVGRHDVDMMPGASGAAIAGDEDDADRVVAINVAEVTAAPAYNLAVMLTPAIVLTIQGWLSAP